jgi:hypothetical protein
MTWIAVEPAARAKRAAGSGAAQPLHPSGENMTEQSRNNFLIAAIVAGLGSTLISGCAQNSSIVKPSQPLACNQLSRDDRAQAEAALDGATWVKELYADRQQGKFKYQELKGVELFVPATPGMTAPWLQRVASCRAAEHASISHAQSPYALHGSRVDVERAAHGFSVRIRHENREHAGELVRRASTTYAAF